MINMSRTLVIAEAGVNHNGSLDNALKLVDAAADAGADFVKFQTFRAESLVTKKAALAEYQAKNTSSESQFSLLKSLELSHQDHMSLARYCDQRGIRFFSTAFDIESLRFLKSFGLTLFKVPSGEITNFPYLREIASFNPEKIILSTGMCDLNEVENALKSFESLGVSRSKITVLHCNTEYPTPLHDVNLRAMLTIRENLKVDVGYSDHTLGITVPIAATAMGATVIEKHFTLDKKMDGPDHKASLDPIELKLMVEGIRAVEVALGDGVKRVSGSEQKNRAIARKSVVAKKAIKAGEVFTEDNLTTKRPGTGISPMLWNELMGRKATKSFVEDEIITL